MSHIQSAGYKKDKFQLAVIAKALRNPVRGAIMNFLSEKENCICKDIVRELPIAQATGSQHLKELNSAGLIREDIEPPKVRYCIDPEKWEYALKLFYRMEINNVIHIPHNHLILSVINCQDTP